MKKLFKLFALGCVIVTLVACQKESTSFSKKQMEQFKNQFADRVFMEDKDAKPCAQYYIEPKSHSNDEKRCNQWLMQFYTILREDEIITPDTSIEAFKEPALWKEITQ